jgi:hypothetical protein
MRNHSYTYEAYTQAAMTDWINEAVCPPQLASHMTPAEWSALANEINVAAQTQPPPCQFCIFSFCLTVCQQAGQFEQAKVNMQALAERHALSWQASDSHTYTTRHAHTHVHTPCTHTA